MQEGGQTAARAGAGATFNQQTVDNAGKIQSAQDTLAQQQQSAATGQLTPEEQAAQTPSFMDELGQGLITGADNAVTAFCPAKGSLYMMADGSEKLVENLEPGEYLAGIDGEPELIERVQIAEVPILRIQTDTGFTARCSASHAFAQPIGGFVEALRSMGKILLTSTGRGKVVSVEWFGSDTVYNVITDGSHTYRADGIWAIGMGEFEGAATAEEAVSYVG